MGRERYQSQERSGCLIDCEQVIDAQKKKTNSPSQNEVVCPNSKKVPDVNRIPQDRQWYHFDVKDKNPGR